MKKIIIYSVFILIMAAFCQANGINMEGSGTEEYPYQITNCAELQQMKYDLTAHYILVNDIDCSDTINWNSGQGFEPIGSYHGRVIFAGAFDGQKHTIDNLFINRNDGGVGLFGYVRDSKIQNVILNDVNINNSKIFTGALVGRANANVSIINCSSSGKVSSRDQVGGLIGGGILTHIESSFSSCNVSGTFMVGGLVGQLGKSLNTVIDCYATGDVSGNKEVGGLIGYIYYANLKRGYSTGSVSGRDYRIGGLVGGVYEGNINHSFSTGNVAGSTDRIGGLVGSVSRSTLFNNYFNNHPNNPSECIGDAFDENCIAIKDNEPYFFDPSNPPMNLWDFENVWCETNTYPTLRAFGGCDSDNDGVIDSEDECLGTTPWYAEELNPNHFDSSNMDLTETYGCSCKQILDSKPGENEGEYKYGCTKGTVDNWIG